MSGYGSCRGTEFDSQHLYQMAHNCMKLQLCGMIHPFLASAGTHTQGHIPLPTQIYAYIQIIKGLGYHMRKLVMKTKPEAETLNVHQLVCREKKWCFCTRQYYTTIENN